MTFCIAIALCGSFNEAVRGVGLDFSGGKKEIGTSSLYNYYVLQSSSLDVNSLSES